MPEPAADVCSVVICDDTAVIRRALHLVLGADPRLDVVAEASSGAEAIETARSVRPDVLLLDVSMPGMDGIEALPHILAASPTTQVLIMSALVSDETKARAHAAGAAGYVEKGTGVPELIERILECAAATRVGDVPDI